MTMLRGQRAYVRSNAITTVDIAPAPDMSTHARRLLAVSETKQRQLLGNALLDALADAAGITIATLKVSDARQYHRRSRGRTVFRQYGYYRPQSRYIYITNRTAVRGQLLAPNAFLETLLHEWVHHYDFCKLHIVSMHTRGFYERIRDVKTKLRVE